MKRVSQQTTIGSPLDQGSGKVRINKSTPQQNPSRVKRTEVGINKSTNQQINDSTIQRFNDSTIQRFNKSTVQQFHKMTHLHQYKKLFGLIGYPLSHSFSKKYFSEKFEREGITDCYYELFPLEKIEDLPEVLARYPNLKGLNVTIPYKEEVFAYLDEVDSSARGVGAVNVIRIEEGKLSGYNSDVYGFSNSLSSFLAENDKRLEGALVLGTGGAAKAVTHVLDELGSSYLLVSRKPGVKRITYDEITPAVLEQYPLIINTTPLGMSPQIGTFPNIPYHYLRKDHLLYDLVYNPEVTTFMRKGNERGCPTKNGLEMLYLQAEKAWEIWWQ